MITAPKSAYLRETKEEKDEERCTWRRVACGSVAHWRGISNRSGSVANRRRSITRGNTNNRPEHWLCDMYEHHNLLVLSPSPLPLFFLSSSSLPLPPSLSLHFLVHTLSINNCPASMWWCACTCPYPSTPMYV